MPWVTIRARDVCVPPPSPLNSPDSRVVSPMSHGASHIPIPRRHPVTDFLRLSPSLQRRAGVLADCNLPESPSSEGGDDNFNQISVPCVGTLRRRIFFERLVPPLLLHSDRPIVSASYSTNRIGSSESDFRAPASDVIFFGGPLFVLTDSANHHAVKRLTFSRSPRPSRRLARPFRPPRTRSRLFYRSGPLNSKNYIPTSPLRTTRRPFQASSPEARISFPEGNRRCQYRPAQK